MSCLTPEQLAALALDGDAGEMPPHVQGCPACRAKFDKLCEVYQELAAVHDNFNARHDASRERLLANLASVERAAPPASGWKRFAFGGFGATAAAVLLLAVVFAASSNQLSAMERMATALQDVSSFTYKILITTDRGATADKPKRTLYDSRYIYWQAPPADAANEFGNFRATSIHEWIDHLANGDSPPRLTMDVLEIYPSGEPGILIDYVAKKYFRTMPLPADTIKNSPPLQWLRAVQQRTGKLVGERGTRRIHGREARGYEMTFDDAEAFKNVGPVEVWIDPETDLPIEFFFRWKNEAGDDFAERYEVTDIQWNTAVDPKLFDTTPPVGFIDVTLPKDEPTIQKIVGALRLYAKLSGGKYPTVSIPDDKKFYAFQFDAVAAERDMLKMAGFDGPTQPSWLDDPKFVEVQQAAPGLQELERILQNHKFLIGYNGDTVGPQDKDKALMWWGIDTGDDRDLSLLVYGDLRTEIVPREKWLPHVSKEIAEATE